MAMTRQLCTFYLDDSCFGVDVQRVQEIIRYQRMTNVPLTTRELDGLINLRGQIVTAIDLRHRLHLEERDAESLPTNVVLTSDDSAVSLLVDSIGDVLDVDDALLEEPPETVAEELRSMISGVYKLDKELLLVLDVERTIQFDASADRSTETKGGRS